MVDTHPLYTQNLWHHDDINLWKALHGQNIKSLSLMENIGGLDVNHVELMSQSLSLLKHIATLLIYVKTFNNIQPPKSLKYLYLYCKPLLPSELRELVGTLSACKQTVESKLEFGCASFEVFSFKRIPPEECIAIKQELDTLKNVAVKRFRILDRMRKTNTCYDDAMSAWSVRDIGGVDDDNPADDNVEDKPFRTFVRYMDSEIMNRISMRLLIIPASKA
ncbi:hypothetical protein DPMN_133959 [Dreissena polymorpha]|uniref:Uncharacterized protein n=1 Tax=Dreissena polymorpha TaxID=45954 RepID=A0A9D4JDE0_DREPO|nr:hypothetical protein DPMN_133959 [Dreissena polymorpha]